MLPSENSPNRIELACEKKKGNCIETSNSEDSGSHNDAIELNNL